MSPGILGKKIGMSQVFRPDGQAVPVTLLKAGPCMVVQRKTPTTDGYDAVQLGLMENIKERYFATRSAAEASAVQAREGIADIADRNRFARCHPLRFDADIHGGLNKGRQGRHRPPASAHTIPPARSCQR